MAALRINEVAAISDEAIGEIAALRILQAVEFPPAVDDELMPAEWIARLVKHTGKAVTTDPATYRKQLVVVAALAIAALEAHDRKYRLELE